MNELSHQKLHRKGSTSKGSVIQERYSIDFWIDGVSLLLSLIEAFDGGHSDYMGLFVRGYSEDNKLALAKLTLSAKPDSPSGRVLIYICPECGDIGCGAFSVSIKRISDGYIWEAFAFENGYKEAYEIKGIGPFRFNLENYESAIGAAAAL